MKTRDNTQLLDGGNTQLSDRIHAINMHENFTHITIAPRKPQGMIRKFTQIKHAICLKGNAKLIN